MRSVPEFSAEKKTDLPPPDLAQSITKGTSAVLFLLPFTDTEDDVRSVACGSHVCVLCVCVCVRVCVCDRLFFLVCCDFHSVFSFVFCFVWFAFLFECFCLGAGGWYVSCCCFR